MLFIAVGSREADAKNSPLVSVALDVKLDLGRSLRTLSYQSKLSVSDKPNILAANGLRLMISGRAGSDDDGRQQAWTSTAARNVGR